MAADRSKFDGVEAAFGIYSGAGQHRAIQPTRLAEEALEGVEAASQADSDQADHLANES